MTPKDNQHLRQLFELIARNQLEHVQVLDSSGQIVFLNEASRQARRAVPGADESTPGVLLHPDDRQITFDALHELRNSQRDSHEVTVRLKQADGSYRWFLSRGTKLRDSSGDTGLVLVTHQDVHDKVLLARERDEQKQELAALRNESRFKAISESSLDLITILDRHGAIVFRNAAALAFAGESNLCEPVGNLIHPDDRDRIRRQLMDVVRTGEVARDRVKLLGHDGRVITTDAIAAPLRLSNGDVDGVLITQRDITEQLAREEKDKQAAIAAARNEADQQLGALLGQSLIGVVKTDLQGIIEEVNPAICTMSGYTREQLLARSLLDFADPEHHAALRVVQEAISKGESSLETRIRAYRIADGSTAWLAGHAAPIRNVQGDVVGTVRFVVDVTQQMLAEQALAESEAKYRLLADNAGDYIQLLSVDGQYLYDSPSIVRLLGDKYSSGRSLGEGVTLTHPEDIALEGRVWADVVRNGLERRVDYRWVLPSGEMRWLECLLRAVRDERGEVVSVLAISRDITERKQAEQALRASRHELDATINASPAVIYSCRYGGDWGATFISSKVTDILGYSVQECLDPDWWKNAIHPEDGDRVFSGLTALDKHDRHSHEYRLATKQGQWRWVLDELVLVRDEQGMPTGITGALLDITDRKLAEQQREQALEQARFANEAKSQFLAKVSHELRTPLNAVTGYGYLLGKTGLDTRQSAYLEQITASSQQLLGLISDVLDLARIEAGQQSVTPAPFTLGALLDSALDVVRPAAQASGIELVCDDVRHLPQQLLGDEGLIKQALLNLLSNAVKFTERGQVRLQVRALADGPATGGSSHLRFEVHDTGAGIAPDRLGELFQPFAQLRADKRGTGLGLDITRRIVELMGGEVGVHSTLGQGSCFWFWVPLELEHLPSAQAPTAQPLTPQAAEESPGELAVQALSARHAGKTILVAEDDIINQALMRLMLERAGLEVAIAGDGEQALQMARAGHYAAVLMDLQMPQMDGIEATRAIRQLPGWQQVPVAALTADVFTETREACLAAGMSEFLGKPVDADKLYPWLLRVLDAEQAH